MNLRQFIVENFTFSELLMLNSAFDKEETDFNYSDTLLNILTYSKYFTDFNSACIVIKSIIIDSMVNHLSSIELQTILVI